LIITGVLAGTATKESKPMEEEDHSWRDILGEFRCRYMRTAAYPATLFAEDEEREANERKKAAAAAQSKGGQEAARVTNAPK
jgi:hypothetical protein